ncbi:MAG: hypothetical protein IJB53_06315, partial [Mailhella sp.]|nr:hypothetical protein [Mailhella sp.]
LYGMAALFLVLLYNSPAALTFYWTLNNVYSLGKNIVEKDWMKRKGWTAALEKLAEQRTRLAQRAAVLWARALSMQVGLSAVVAVFGGAGLFMLIRGLLGHGKYSFEMSAMLFGAFLLLIGICSFAEEKVERLRKMPLPQALAVLASIIGVSYILAKYGFHQGSAKKVAMKVAMVAGVVCVLTYGRTLLSKMYARVVPQKKELGALFLPAAGLIAFLVFVYCPFMVFSSDPAVFEMTLEDFASGRFGTFFVAMICLAVVGVLVRPVKWVFGSVFVMLALAALTFCFVVAPDVGVMDSFVLQKAEVLIHQKNILIDIAVFAAVGLIFITVVLLRKVKIFSSLIYASLTVLVIMTGVHYSMAKDMLANRSQYALASSDSLEVPEYVKDFFTFSKNGKNIVVVMLDMFTGGNMNQLLEEHPELKTELDGFTWFEDVVAGGSVTILGKPAILGGEACTPITLNKDTSRSLEEKVAEAHGTFLRKLQDQDFRISVYDIEFFHPELLNKYLLPGAKTTFVNHKKYTLWEDAYLYWGRMNRFYYNKLQSYDKFWGVIGLFNVSPLVYKNDFYDDGCWKKTISKSNHNIRYAADQISNLDLPSYASSVSEEKDNTFIYMMNLLTHMPWAIDEYGMPCSNGGLEASRDLKNGGLSQEHLRTEYYALKTLIKWFLWMKEHDVYDNTHIILVSDHDARDSMELVKIWNGYAPVGAHGLLLIKEPGKRGELCIDRTTQMANWDVPYIVLNSLCKEASKMERPWKKERARFSVNARFWRREDHEKNSLSLEHIYKIQGPLYNRKSWVKVN